MRIRKLNLSNIHYIRKNYSQNLKESILRIGFSFPIKVRLTNNQYYCIDGHKRLSCLEDILLSDSYYKRGSEIPVIIDNNGDIRSNDQWYDRNKH